MPVFRGTNSLKLFKICIFSFLVELIGLAIIGFCLYMVIINYKNLRLFVVEESYTSKCDGLVLEKVGKHEVYLGKRVKRGLYQSSCGKLINADINGALNIMRKVVGDSSIEKKIINRGLLFRPKKFNNLFDLIKY